MPEVNEKDVKFVGRYTEPPTWGVYKSFDIKDSTTQYHYGNHPVRQEELERKYGKDNVIRKNWYDSEEEAKAKKKYYNDRDKG